MWLVAIERPGYQTTQIPVLTYQDGLHVQQKLTDTLRSVDYHIERGWANEHQRSMWLTKDDDTWRITVEEGHARLQAP